MPSTKKDQLRRLRPKRVSRFRALMGEEGYAEWRAEQKEKARRMEEYINSLPPEAQHRARDAQWWNSTGRFQRG